MATINDVAKLAGLAVGTVSRVFNNRGYISEKTRQKVDAACKELNYFPSEAARTLIGKKSTLVALLVPELKNPFFAHLTQEVEKVLHKMRHKLILCISNQDPAKEKEYFELLKAQKVKGLIIASHTLGLEEYADSGLQVVSFDRYLGKQIPLVSADHAKAGAQAAKILGQSGCQLVAHVQGSTSFKGLSNLRTEAFLEELNARKITYTTIKMEQDETHDSILHRLDRLFTENPGIDGFFGSDIQAAYVHQILERKNKRIPEDCRIIGFDGILEWGMETPRISTFRQPLGAMAQALVNHLLNEDFPDIPRIHKFKAQFIQGLSS